jgi:hypothetical protein
LLSRLLGISSTLKVTTNIKMIEVFMLVGLMLTFGDVLMQSYLHHKEYQGPKGDLRLLDNDPEEEEDPEAGKDLLMFLAMHGYLGNNIKDQSNSMHKKIITQSEDMPAVIDMEHDSVAAPLTGEDDDDNVKFDGGEDSSTTPPAGEKNGGSTIAPMDPERIRKEAIFDLAMSPETAEQPEMRVARPETAVAVPECWDDKKVQGEENK